MSEKVESPEHAQTWSAQLPVLARRPHGATGRPGRSLRRSIRTGGLNGQAETGRAVQPLTTAELTQGFLLHEEQLALLQPQTCLV